MDDDDNDDDDDNNEDEVDVHIEMCKQGDKPYCSPMSMWPGWDESVRP